MANMHLYKKNPSVDNIRRHILEKDPSKEYAYIILGKPGPTGKTTLCGVLKIAGYNAFEITEDLLYHTRLDGIENYFIVNEYQKYTLVILNRYVR